MLSLFEPTISQARIGTYMAHVGHDEFRALALYLWNAQVGEAFHLPIQSVEISFRNRINAVLVMHFGTEWWQESVFLATVEKYQIDSIAEVKRRIAKRGSSLVTGQIVAGLSFGFWVSMLDARYNPAVWSKHLRTGFPDLPTGTTRNQLQVAARRVANFRNRIWHHEPIFRDNISEEYAHCIDMLGWICRHKAAWVKPQCKVMAVLRCKP